MTTHIQRILIANRAEIAVRIIHACQDEGRTAIAVYADDDADALFVQLADEAYGLDGSSPNQTYLDIDKIITVARRCHADAIHPGYGFLSENADFAQAVHDAGMVWIGPSPQTIRALGDKVQARSIAAEVGAPMVPGTTAPVHDGFEVVAFAKQYGLPIAIKAVHGGGGRGMKVVRRIDDIGEAFASATHEAEVAFGNGDCFIERFLDRPRHVEVQILGDSYGKVIALGTRDCSLQRRNQKLVEEAPAPFLDAAIEQRLKDAAVAICAKAAYTSAGTVEFLVDTDGSASFMEVNTRIQVEHPVTEMTTGIDIVHEQFRIAEGGSISQLHPQERGHAIEMRINAEDPAHGFVPYPGTISKLRIPSGPGIRFDTGIQEGSCVSDQFDSMLAKLVVYADTREACLARARRAVQELCIEGVPTVLPFDRAVLSDPDFCGEDNFNVYTRWIEEELLNRIEPSRFEAAVYGPRGAGRIISRTWIEIDDRRIRLGLPEGLNLQGQVSAGKSEPMSQTVGDTEPGAIKATVTGVLARWIVADGAEVESDQPVAVLEAMKMEMQVASPSAGILHHGRWRIGEQVSIGAVIATVDLESSAGAPDMNSHHSQSEYTE